MPEYAFPIVMSQQDEWHLIAADDVALVDHQVEYGLALHHLGRGNVSRIAPLTLVKDGVAGCD